MNIPFFIARRIAFNGERSFSRFIIRLAIAATVISVAAMILSLAFVNGFQKVISEKVFSFWGHVRVQHFEPFKVSIAEESPIPRNDTVEHAVAGIENVRHIAPFATRSAILNAHSTIAGVLFKGVGRDYHFSELNGFLKEGNWPDYSDTAYSNDIVISQLVADEVDIKVNDPLLIYFIQPGQEHPRTRKLRVSGIFKTGIDVYDKNFAIGVWYILTFGGSLLVNNDRLGMQRSVETRFPYASERMLRVALRTPFDWNTADDDIRCGKAVLRQLGRNRLPREIWHDRAGLPLPAEP